MPKVIKKKSTELNPACNFTDLSQNEFIMEQMSLVDLKARCDNYFNYLTALQPPQQNTMIRAASFTVDSIQQLLNQSPGSTFLRVYYGIEADGNHLFFMAPVTETGALATEEEIIYADECCHCPPIANCPADPLLNQNP